jgi:hypothetical protein
MAAVFRLIVVLSAIYVVLGVLHLVLACAEENLKAYVFGYHGYYNFTHAMYLVRPFISIASVFASTLMVRWIVRAYPQIAEARTLELQLKRKKNAQLAIFALNSTENSNE